MKSPQSQRPAKYHGLENKGATCYLNSVLQVLFMTEDFKERVKRNNAGKEHIDSDLCDLFNKLKEYHAHTDTIRKRLKIKNVHEQRDAAEHYEKILRLTSPEASEIFHGELINRSTCKECNTQTESEAGFWHLPLPLVHSDKDYSVEKGIEDYFRSSVISGDDQMHCEKCDEKCDAVLDCEVKHHPEVLVLLLKRFEFDFSYMTYVKINCAVNVPYLLQTPQNQSYELYAVVEHFGELGYGHYISKIKSQDNGKWYIFDDLKVTESEYEYFQLDPTERSKTAYLLFYRKHKADIKIPSTLEASQIEVTNRTEDSQSPTQEEERGQNVKNEADVKNKPVRAASKRGTLPVDGKQGDENSEHPCNKKQKKEKKVGQEDAQKSNIDRNGEERKASSQVVSYARFQENNHSRWPNNKNTKIEILEYDSEQRGESESRQFAVAKSNLKTPRPYKDNSNVTMNANYARQTSLDMQTQMKTYVNHYGHNAAVRTLQSVGHSSDWDCSYDDGGKKCVSQKAQDLPNIGAQGFDESKRRHCNKTLTDDRDFQNDEGGFQRQHRNNVRSDPGLNSVFLNRQCFVRQKDDVYQDKHGNIKYQLDMKGRHSLKQHRGNTRSEGNAKIKPMGFRNSFHVTYQKTTPNYPSQDFQLENFRRQVGPNPYYMGNEGLKKNEMKMYDDSSQHVNKQSHVEKALQRHKSREIHSVPKEDIDYAQQCTERSQQKGPGSGQTEKTGKSQRNQRRHEHSGAQEGTSDRNTETYKSEPKKSQDGTGVFSKSHSQSRVDLSHGSLTRNSPSNKCHNPGNSIDDLCEDMKKLSVAEGMDERQKEDKLMYKTIVKKAKRSKWNDWLFSCFPRKNKHSKRSEHRKCLK